MKKTMTAIEKKIKNFSYTENSVICSQHFTKDCYIRTSYGRLYLKTNTIPTVFNILLRNEYSTQVDQMQQKYTYNINANTTEKWVKDTNEKYLELREQSLPGTSMTEDIINLEETHLFEKYDEQQSLILLTVQVWIYPIYMKRK